MHFLIPSPPQHKRRKIQRKTMAYSSLLPELMLDLFSRLTVKDLHCCRCVSKEWLSLISNRNLRSLHRRHWSQHPLFLVIDNIHSSRYIITVSEMDGTVLNEFIVDLPVTSSFCIIGYTYYELICFSINQKHLYICNPSTQELMPLPNSPHSSSPSRQFSPFPPMGFFTFTKQQHILAIGRVPSLDQYKLVRLFVRRLGNGEYGLGCETFTITYGVDVSSGTWTMIGDCPCLVSPTSHAIVGHSIYWPVADRAHRNRKNHILRMNLETNMFDFLSGPEDYPYGLDHDDDDNDYVSFSLHELKGSLCLVNRYQPSFVLDVWMLEDPGNGIWVKKHSIDLPPLDHHCMIQGFVPSDEDDGSLVIFIPSNQGYYFYNIRTDKFSAADNLNAEGLHSYFVYYENFFSFGNTR